MSAPAAEPSGKGWLLDFVTLGAIWGSSFLFMRIAGKELGALPTAAVRVAIGALFLLPFMLYKGQGQALRQHYKPIFLVGMLNSGIPFALYCFALQSISTGLSSILNASVPMFGALVAWLWLRDRPNTTRIVGLLVGFSGVALLAWGQTSGHQVASSGSAPAWAVAACLGACVCYAVAASFTRLYLQQVPSLAIATGSQIGAALGLLIPAVWLWPDQAPSQNAWLALVAVGVVCTGVAYILFYRLIVNAGPSRTLAVTYLIPVFAVVYGLIFLNETFSLTMLASAAVIVSGTALLTGLLQPASWPTRLRAVFARRF